jgi:NitT/TauT family transport system substrate-binding protein
MANDLDRGLVLDRRRLLTLTATGISAATLGGFGRIDSALAADSVRWVSPRGTIEVLDDYPYHIAKKFGYFGDIATTLEPGPSEATATVKLVDQKQADVGYPSPGVFSLALAQGIPLVSVFEMGGGDVFDFAFRKGEAAKTPKDLEGKTIVLGSAGWPTPC